MKRGMECVCVCVVVASMWDKYVGESVVPEKPILPNTLFVFQCIRFEVCDTCNVKVYYFL